MLHVIIFVSLIHVSVVFVTIHSSGLQDSKVVWVCEKKIDGLYTTLLYTNVVNVVVFAELQHIYCSRTASAAVGD